MSFAHLGDVLAEVQELGNRFREAGFRLFLVGGIVRDQWLDQSLDSSSDIDLTTNARPAEIKALVSSWADDMWTQGERFGTIGLRTSGRDYEITTHRAESYSSDSRKPTVTFGDDIEVDLSRRDFTVNAMAIELPNGDLVDPWGGAADLASGVLRTPLSADLSFSDDPLRMLRAARFATKFGLAYDPELHASAAQLHQRLRIVAIERIGVEVERLLSLDDPTIGLEFLADTGLLAEVLCFGAPDLIQGVAPRLSDGIAAVGRARNDWRLRLAVLGATVCESTSDVQALVRRLRLSREDANAVAHAVRLAEEARLDAPATFPRLRRWIASDRGNQRSTAIEVAQALEPGSPVVQRFVEALENLAASEVTDEIVLLDGAQIMNLLDVEPGQIVGQAVEHLRECYFEQGPLDEPTQVALLQEWSAAL